MAKSDIDHKILEGKFKGKMLNALSIPELTAYIKELQANPENPYLLEVAMVRFRFLKFPPKGVSPAPAGNAVLPALEKVLEKNFKNLAKKYHPDKHLENKDFFNELMADLNNFRENIVKDVKQALGGA